MDWTDDALVLGLRKHGETSVILEAMTRDHGRHLGLVRGGRSREQRPILQAGQRREARLARADRRAPRDFRGRRADPACRPLPVVAAGALRGDPRRRPGAPIGRARPAPGRPCRDGAHPRKPRRRGDGAGTGGAVRARDAGRARLRPRPVGVRRDRRYRRPRLRLAEVRPGGEPGGGRRPTRTASWRCPRSCATREGRRRQARSSMPIA